MSRLEFLLPSDPILNKVSRKVLASEIGSDYIEGVVAAMTQIAVGERDERHPERKALVGLAAPQIGEFVRIILFDRKAAGGKPNFSPDLQFVINPEITSSSADEELGREGCYSTGEICAVVYRAKTIELTGLSTAGEPINVELTGFQARIAQHEIDHLNGIRCPDRVRSPGHLHKVGPDDFQSYRENWKCWTKLCSLDDWLKMKNGG